MPATPKLAVTVIRVLPLQNGSMETDSRSLRQTDIP